MPPTLTIASFSLPETIVEEPLSLMDDMTLVNKFLRSDDEEVFSILVRRYQEKVFRLASSILGYRAVSEAEDATQEVFVVVLRRLKTFRQESAFSTWLYRVARNQIIDYQRRTLQRGLEVNDSVLLNIPDDKRHTDPREAVNNAQMREHLMRQIYQLSEAQRIVIHLHYWQGQSVVEICELLDLSPGTVKSHLFRARQRLAKLFREEENDGQV